MRREDLYLKIALWVFIFLSLVLLAEQLRVRIDLTQDKRYTLSQVTRKLISRLENPVTIIAYFTKQLPPHLQLIKQDALYILEEYSIESDGKIIYKVVNPNESPEKEREAQSAGISPLLVAVEEEDQVRQQKAYLGLVFHYQDKQEVLPVIPLDGTYEYAITSILYRLTTKQRTPIGYIQGFGEPSLSQIKSLSRALTALYVLNTIDLSDSPVPAIDTLPVLLWIQPRDSVPEPVLARLEKYLRRGGRMCLLYDPFNASLQSQFIGKKNSNVHKWLEREFGIKIEERVIADANCGQVLIQQRQGFFVLNVPVQFPYFPLITNFEKHPITHNLEQVQLLFAASISTTSPSPQFKPLAYTSELTTTQSIPAFVDISRQWKREDFPLSHLPVAALYEDTISGMKLFVVGDAEFVLDQNNQPPPLDNIALVANALEYLTDVEGLASLRTKTAIVRPLKPIASKTKRQTIKLINALLPPVMVIFMALAWFWYRNAQVRRWLQKKVP